MNIQELADLEKKLTDNNSDVVLDALRSIEDELSIYISNTIIELAYHHNKKIRAEAYAALYYVRDLDLTRVIRDGLEDTDKIVFRMATQLFHRDKLIA